jgi:hypothetical protein
VQGTAGVTYEVPCVSWGPFLCRDEEVKKGHLNSSNTHSWEKLTVLPGVQTGEHSQVFQHRGFNRGKQLWQCWKRKVRKNSVVRLSSLGLKDSREEGVSQTHDLVT